MTTNPSIIWFTAHKCASVYARSILQNLAQDQGMIYVDYEGDFWLEGKSLRELFSKKSLDVFKTTGHIYGPFRQYYSIPEMEKYKVILMLRDPRDVLTSLYFSIAYSHFIPEIKKAKMESSREDVKNKNIDNFVIEQAPWLRKNYEQYGKSLLGKNNVLFLSYEDMVINFPLWLSELFKYLQINNTEHLIKKLIYESKFEVKEDVYSHKRQVKPGDHRRKLQVNTIKQLNLELLYILKRYGWLRDGLQEADELFKLNLERAIQKLDNFQLLLEQAKQQITSD